MQDVAANRTVRREHDVGLGEFFSQSGPRHARVLDHRQIRSEPRALLEPVENQRLGHDDKRRMSDLSLAKPILQQRQKLHRLAEPHVVGQAPAEPEIVEEFEPADAGALVRPQFAGESFGFMRQFQCRRIP